jgi:hypothetical protein
VIVMLPVHRMAQRRSEPVQVIGLYEDSKNSEDRWLVIEEDGRPTWAGFAEVVFDGWLP